MKAKFDMQAFIENQREILSRIINLELLLSKGQQVLKPTNRSRKRKESIEAIVNDKLKKYLL